MDKKLSQYYGWQILRDLIWQDKVISFYDNSTSLPSSSEIHDRYISLYNANGWIKDYIYEWDGEMWFDVPPKYGTALLNRADEKYYYFNGINWEYFDSYINHNLLYNYNANEHRAWENSITQNIHKDNITSLSITQYETSINHDNLNNYNANEHRAWENSITQNIHQDNITSVSVTQHESNINHNALTNYDSTEHFKKEDINQLYQPDGTNPFVYTDNGGTLHIDGDISQNGSAYETHAEQVYTTQDLIITRNESISAISAGDISGIKITKYDGTNDLLFGTDSGGYFKIGEPASLQILATREDTPNDTSLTYWNDTEKRLNTDSNLTWDGTTLSASNISGSNTEWDTAYNRSVTGVSGDGNSTLTITRQDTNLTTDLTHTHTNSEITDFNSGIDNRLSGGTDIDYSNGIISHSNTSSQLSSVNSNRTYIQSIELDGRGHVTSLSTATETVIDTTYTAGDGIFLTGTEFSVLAGTGLSQEASGLALNASLDDLNDVTIGTPETDNILKWDGSNWISGNVDGGLSWLYITTNTTAEDKGGYVMSGDITLTLPTTPEIGEQIGWKNISGEQTIARNGAKIEGEESDLTIDLVGSGGLLVYQGTEYGWVNVTEIGGSAGPIYVGTNPPENPVEGELWFDSTGSGLYIWYNDGESEQWVEVVGGGGAYDQSLNKADDVEFNSVTLGGEVDTTDIEYTIYEAKDVNGEVVARTTVVYDNLTSGTQNGIMRFYVARSGSLTNVFEMDGS